MSRKCAFDDSDAINRCSNRCALRIERGVLRDSGYNTRNEHHEPDFHAMVERQRNHGNDRGRSGTRTGGAEMSKDINPSGRVDVLMNRTVDLALKRFVEPHPLHERLKQVGLDVGEMLREEISRGLKRAKVSDLKSALKAWRR